MSEPSSRDAPGDAHAGVPAAGVDSSSSESRSRRDRSSSDKDRDNDRKHDRSSREKDPKDRSSDRDRSSRGSRDRERKRHSSRSRSRSRGDRDRHRRSRRSSRSRSRSRSPRPISAEQAHQNMLAHAAQQQLYANLYGAAAYGAGAYGGLPPQQQQQRGNFGGPSSFNNRPGGGPTSALPKQARPNRLYMGSIQYHITKEQLRELLSIFGNVVDLDMPIDNATGRHKGFLFCEFDNVESALQAIANLNGRALWGRVAKINRPCDNGQPAPPPQNNAIAETINQILGPAAPAPSAPSAAAGGALVHEALAQIQANLAGGSGSAPTGGMYLPPPSSGAVSMGTNNASNSTKRIYVGNIVFDLCQKSELIKELFTPFGTVRSIDMVMDRENNRPKGFAFLEFEDEKSAAEAIVSMQGFECCGRLLKVNSAVNPTSGLAGPPIHTVQPNINAMNQAKQIAMLFQSVGIGSGLAAAQSTSYENDGYLNSASQRVALMDKLAGRTSEVPESAVILLRNLVQVGEVDDGLEEEVRDEAGQYGTVLKVVIHETAKAVLIFVLFDSSVSAGKARQALDKRFFGGHIVTAQFFPQDKFEKGQFNEA